MRICGIIAEYNPLHNGHLHHIQAARASGCDYIMVVMSGSFVQRGEVACADKWQRTRWALTAGADAVLELPSVFVLQSAKYFAQGGVKTLLAAGMNTLCFGSEYADSNLIKSACELSESSCVKEQLAQGKSYAKAMGDAMILLDERIAKACALPNFMLGVEYYRAVSRYANNVNIMPIQRIGGGYHDANITGAFSSATAIRRSLKLQQPCAKCLPDFVQICGIATLEQLSQTILYKLRTANTHELDFCGVAEGLENVLKSSAQESCDLDSLLSSIKSKRYTMARIKRILCCMLLGITSDIADQANQSDIPYLRLLGFRKSAQPLVSHLSQGGSLICRKSDMDKLPPFSKALLNFDIIASDIQALAGNSITKAGRDFTEKMIVLDPH